MLRIIRRDGYFLRVSQDQRFKVQTVNKSKERQMKKNILRTIPVIFLAHFLIIAEEKLKTPDQEITSIGDKEEYIQIPGTSVCLRPLEGFVAADRFPGFMNEETGSSIMVSELTAPYQTMIEQFSNKEKMKEKGMVMINHSSVKVDGKQAELFKIEQEAYEIVFNKWVLIIDNSGSIILILATYIKDPEGTDDINLKEAILSATFQKASNPLDAINFEFSTIEPFKIANVMGQTVILSLDGQYPVKVENEPIVIIGLSGKNDIEIPDKKAFAIKRVAQTALVKSITVEQTVAVTIGNLSGYKIIANGFDKNNNTPMTIFQVLLFEESGYSIVVGITPSAKNEIYIPLFDSIATSFKPKKKNIVEKPTSHQETPQVLALRDMQKILLKGQYEKFYREWCHPHLTKQLTLNEFVVYMKSEEGHAIVALYQDVLKAVDDASGPEILISQPEKDDGQYEFILVVIKKLSSKERNKKQWHLELQLDNGIWKLLDTD